MIQIQPASLAAFHDFLSKYFIEIIISLFYLNPFYFYMHHITNVMFKNHGWFPQFYHYFVRIYRYYTVYHTFKNAAWTDRIARVLSEVHQ